MLISGNILYGLLLGALLSQVIPPLTKSRARRKQVRHILVSAAIATGLAVPYVWFSYPNNAQMVLPGRLILIAMLPLALGLPFLLAGDASPTGSNNDGASE